MGAGRGEKVYGYLKTSYESIAMQEESSKEPWKRERGTEEGRKRKEEREIRGKKEGKERRHERRKATDDTTMSECWSFPCQGGREEGSARNHVSYIRMSSSHTPRAAFGMKRPRKDDGLTAECIEGPSWAQERKVRRLPSGVLYIDADDADDLD